MFVQNHRTQNFLLSNYESQEGIDNDECVWRGPFPPTPTAPPINCAH